MQRKMKNLELGKPIELDEKTARLLQQISAGEWGEIDRQTLRSIVDRDSFVKFLKLRNLFDTAEAKTVLERLDPAPAERTMAAGAGASGGGSKVEAKHQAPGRILVSVAKKSMGKTKRGKAAKRRPKYRV
jgi:hypothetical protein